jgi:hypothetical protein
MNGPPAASAEFLASFCLVEETDVRLELPKAIALAKRMHEIFRYFEIIYLVNEGARDTVLSAASDIAGTRNLRIVFVNAGHSFYRRRLIAASEAIGDVVVLASFDELDEVDVSALARAAYAHERIQMVRRANSGAVFAVFHHLLTLSSTYRVDPADMRTIALPRGRLESILARSTATLDLRFEPRRGGDYDRYPVEFSPSLRRRTRMVERNELAAELVANSAPRYLKGYAMLAVLVAAGAAVYAVYVVAVLAFVRDVQPGWFSTNIVQAGSTAFIAGGLSIIALGIAEMYERSRGQARWTIVDEVANTTYFEHADKLNVDIEAKVDAA